MPTGHTRHRGAAWCLGPGRGRRMPLAATPSAWGRHPPRGAAATTGGHVQEGWWGGGRGGRAEEGNKGGPKGDGAAIPAQAGRERTGGDEDGHCPCHDGGRWAAATGGATEGGGQRGGRGAVP